MVGFSYEQSVVIKPGDPVILPEIKMLPGSKYWIECKWIRDGKEESNHWEIKNDSIEGAYTIWREENWKRLFDPFKVKILSLTISRIQVTFADFVEKLLNENYSPEEKAQLNKIFMNREETLKPRRKDGVQSRAILSILAAEYEKFIFDTLKRRMEEEATCRNTKPSGPCATKCD